MSTINYDLRLARPKLKVVSPLSHWIVLVMAWFNLALGAALYFAVDADRASAPFLIVNDLLTFKFWGLVFIGIGLLKLFALYTNRWTLTRYSLFIGVSIKAAWMVALVIRVFVSPGTVFLSLLWITIALIQMGCYVWFMPPNMQSTKQKEDYE